MTDQGAADLDTLLPGNDQEAALWRVFEQSGEGIMITDRDNRIVAVNPAFCSETGYSAGEVLGRDPAFLTSGHASPELYPGLWQVLKTEGRWSGEVWKQRKDGSLVPQWLTVSVLRDAGSGIRGYVANFTALSLASKAAERLADLAYHDPLTQLPNRLSFMAQFVQTLRLAERESRQMAVMMIDLDHFKTINDTLGHHVGDGLLREVGRRLQRTVRTSDLVARLGGDEFVVVLPRIDGALTAARVANKILDALGSDYLLDEHVVHVTASLGISLFPNDGQDVDGLLRHADAAMYQAKRQGRNTHRFHADRMNATAGERLTLETELRRAVAGLTPASREFALHFQPQVARAGGRVGALEALLRWTLPDGSPVSTPRLVAIAEETGLIQPLGDWAIREALRHCRLWQDQGYALPVAINLSAQQLRHDKLLPLLEDALRCHDLQPADIVLEITESTAMQAPEATLAIIDRLAHQGITLAIDNFGTGYASLPYLKHLPIRQLKLDRSFVKDIEHDPDAAAICAASIALGHALGFTVIAVGVETEAQHDFLARLDCDSLQGHRYSPALPSAELIPYLRGGQSA